MKSETPRKKIRRRILTETKQILVLGEAETPGNPSCPICENSAEMISPLLAAKLFDVSTREVYRQIDAGNLHSLELEDRRIFVCLETLKQISRTFLSSTPAGCSN